MREVKRLPQGIGASLSNALDRHFVACAAVATVAAVAGQAEHAQAGIIYSGVQDVTLTNGSPGIYINMVTNTSSGTPAGAPGWEINPYVNGGSTGSYFGMYLPLGATQLVKSSTTPGGGDVGNLSAGTVIGPGSTWIGQPSQFGFMNNNTAGAWVQPTDGYMGIEFKDPSVNGGNLVYGWMQISKTSTGEPARGGPTGITFVDWAYDNSGSAIAAGDTGASPVPEPASLALMAAGAIGILVRRGRVQLRRGEPDAG